MGALYIYLYYKEDVSNFNYIVLNYLRVKLYGNRCGKKWSRPNLKCYLGICLELPKMITTVHSVSLVFVLAKIETQHPMNMIEKCCYLSQIAPYSYVDRNRNCEDL